MSHLGHLLSAVVDGELSGAELDRANAHLAACAACRGEAHALRRLKEQLRAIAAEVVCPGDITERLLALSPATPAKAPSAQAAAAAEEPPAYRRQPSPRRRRPAGSHRGRQVLLGTLSLVVVGIGGAAFGLGGAGPAEPRITPQLGSFGPQHADMSGSLLILDPDAFTGPEALTGRIRAA